MVGSRARALVVVASLFCGGPTAAAEQPSAAQMMDDLMYGRGPVGGPFTLTDQTGKQRSDSEFRGKLMIVYFGYTYCPDVCPTDLMAITQALDALGPAAEGVQPVFITIDPERDTKVLADYVSAFHHSRQRLQGVLCEGAGRAERGLFNRPCRRHLFDGPPWRVSGVHAAADQSRPADRGIAQKSR
jgi:cytochrome oxidase Cu insertion factor (SCO1/SenC/PrrC family)